MSTPIMEIKNLNYHYADGTHALNNIQMTFERGKTTAILGGNGAGKSTLFLNMNGILKPSSGEIVFRGQPLDHSKKGLQQLRRSVGLVFQDPDNQLFSANVYQDISFGPMNLKLPEAEIIKRTESAMIRTGVQLLRDKPTHALSYGQKKRVAIAGVLAMEPDILILDEPTAGLDPHGVSEIMKLLKEFQKQLGLTIIIATHDIDMVPLYSDYVFVMHQGKVETQGTPNEVFENPDLLRRVHLRLPRIAHLMEILKTKEHFKLEKIASTISEARSVFVKWHKEWANEAKK